MSKTYYSARELAGKVGLPNSERAIQMRADKENWPKQPRAGRGGGWEYPITCLPEITRHALLDAAYGAQPTPQTISNQSNQNLPRSVGAANVPPRSLLVGSMTSPSATPLLGDVMPAASTKRTRTAVSTTAIALPARHHDTSTLKDWQRTRMEARIAIVRHVEEIGRTLGIGKAVAYVVGKAAAQELPLHLQELVRVANARTGEGNERGLSDRSLYRWMAEFKGGGTAALAPKTVEKVSVPVWAPALMDEFRKPSKPSLRYCVTKLAKSGAAINYDAAYRFMQKVGAMTREAGRQGPRELRKMAPFVRRDWSELKPGDVYQMDGHQFDAEVAHPVHGKPFRPEITTVIDCATRCIVGFSVGFAESSWVVMDALRDASMRAGIPALLYTDNGSGYINERVIGRMTGLIGRIGTTHTTSIPYNSQARGIIERVQQTLWIPLAKDYATYMGADMDPQAKQAVFKLTRNELTRAKKLRTWGEFVDDCESRCAEYNATPHSTLKCSPDQAWAKGIAAGTDIIKLAEDEARDLFRPTVIRQVARGEIEVFGNRYFARELDEFHGEKVMVAYEVRDPSHIYVRTLAGQLVCEATFEGNKRAGFAQSVVEQARQKRAKGQLKRLESKIDTIREEAEGIDAIEHTAPTFSVPTMPISNHAEPLLEAASAPDNVIAGDFTASRPMFGSEGKKYEWLMVNKTQWTDDDLVWLSDYVNGEIYAELRPLYQAKGLEWPEGTGFRVAAA